MKPSQAPQSMDNDFLEGIDDQFQRLMRANGSKRNGRPGVRSPEDQMLSEILEQLQGLSRPDREAVLSFIQSLKQKATDG
jgi:hypothetical protein